MHRARAPRAPHPRVGAHRKRRDGLTRPPPAHPFASDGRTVSLEQSGDGLESVHDCFASRFARTLIACKHHKFNLRTAMATRPWRPNLPLLPGKTFSEQIAKLR